jgi:hypothetical protein
VARLRWRGCRSSKSDEGEGSARPCVPVGLGGVLGRCLDGLGDAWSEQRREIVGGGGNGAVAECLGPLWHLSGRPAGGQRGWGSTTAREGVPRGRNTTPKVICWAASTNDGVDVLGIRQADKGGTRCHTLKFPISRCE